MKEHLTECNNFKGARLTDSQTMASFLFIEFQSRQPQELSPPRAVLIMCHKAYLAEKGITR